MRGLAMVLLVVLVGCSSAKPAPPPVPHPVPGAKNTLTWDRINEPGVKEYRVYVCWMPGCDPAVINTMLKVVPQPPVGTKPTYWRELAGSVGAYAVTARDTAGRESPFSEPLAFDRR